MSDKKAKRKKIMKEFSLRLHEAFDDSRFVTQKELAEELGMNPNMLSRYFCATSYPEGDTILKLALELDVSAEWLWTGRGNKYVDNKSFFVGGEYLKNAVKIKKLAKPIEAGITSFDVSQIPENENGNPIFLEAEWVRSGGYKSQNLVAFPVRGDSMLPWLFDGDVVIVNTEDKEFSSGHVFAVFHDGSLSVKRLKNDGKRLWLSSDNGNDPRYYDKPFNESTRIIGKVIFKYGKVP